MPYLPATRIPRERIRTVFADHRCRHRTGEGTGARSWSQRRPSVSLHLAPVRPAAGRDERQQLGERTEGRPHQDRQAAQADEPYRGEHQRELDPVHRVV
jgi:hypothetical protein